MFYVSSLIATILLMIIALYSNKFYYFFTFNYVIYMTYYFIHSVINGVFSFVKMVLIIFTLFILITVLYKVKEAEQYMKFKESLKVITGGKTFFSIDSREGKPQLKVISNNKQ